MFQVTGKRLRGPATTPGRTFATAHFNYLAKREGNDLSFFNNICAPFEVQYKPTGPHEAPSVKL